MDNDAPNPNVPTSESGVLGSLTQFWCVVKEKKALPKLTRKIENQELHIARLTCHIISTALSSNVKQWAAFNDSHHYWQFVAISLKLPNPAASARQLKTWANAKSLLMAEFLVKYHGWDAGDGAPNEALAANVIGAGASLVPNDPLSPGQKQVSQRMEDGLVEDGGEKVPNPTASSSPRKSTTAADGKVEEPQPVPYRPLMKQCSHCKESIHLRSTICSFCKTNLKELKALRKAGESEARLKRWAKSGTYRSITRSLFDTARHFRTRFPKKSTVLVFVVKRGKRDFVDCYADGKVQSFLQESTLIHQVCKKMHVKCHALCGVCQKNKEAKGKEKVSLPKDDKGGKRCGKCRRKATKSKKKKKLNLNEGGNGAGPSQVAPTSSSSSYSSSSSDSSDSSSESC